MNSHPAAIENAFHDFLAARGLSVNELTLGSAFNVMLEFYRDVKFSEVEPDRDTLSLSGDESRDEDSLSGGFLGMFKTWIPGKLTGYEIRVSRHLRYLVKDDWDFVTLNVMLSYAITNRDVSEFQEFVRYTESDDFKNLETFVATVLKLNLFKTTALETPLATTLELW